MRTIYLDTSFRCHIYNDGTMTAVETNYFDDKCDAFVEGYCYKPEENGPSIYPWKDYAELDAAQRQYEQERLADAEQALAIMWGGVEA